MILRIVRSLRIILSSRFMMFISLSCCSVIKRLSILFKV